MQNTDLMLELMSRTNVLLFFSGFFSVSKLDYPKSDKQTNQRGKKKLSEAYTFMSQGNVKH